MRRFLGIAFGLATHGLFAVTVWYLYWFLKGPGSPSAADSHLVLDALLATQFTMPHSILLLPAVRDRLTRIIPASFYGCFYCVVTCLSLLVMFANWEPSATVVWQLSGIGRTAVTVAFLASWGALLYSLSLTGLGYQTGWTPWWHWLHGVPLPARRFEPRGAYLWLRHPVYLSFLGLIWFTPVMTADHAVLTGIWTTYIFVGSCLKDRRLVFYLGRSYREYQAAVAGYPGMMLGPLARKTLSDLETAQNRSGQETGASVLSRRAA
jgi:protein-S-isoprenylcysteine O-methyltransferase Ste14